MKILHLISSPRKEGSFSIKLGNGIVKQLQEKHPGSTVITHNLAESSFPHLEELQMTSFFTPHEARSEALAEAVKHSDASVAELMDADVVVIGVPMYNFSIHSSLKAWIDHVVRAGVTFSYGAEGAKGLVTGKKAYLAMASGAVFSDGPMRSFDFAEPYLRHMLSFIGITDITTYRVEGLSMPGLKDVALEKAMEGIAV